MQVQHFNAPLLLYRGYPQTKGNGGSITWITEYLIKNKEDIELTEKYMPVAKLDKAAVSKYYDILKPN